MPYDTNGNATITRDRAVTGQKVQAAQVNVPFDDTQSMLSQVLLRSGVAPLSGNLSAAGFKITGAAAGTSDADYVTFAQLNELVQSIASVAPTGAVYGFRRTTAPAGWVKENGGTIGNAASGGTTRANGDTSALFALLWEQFSNTVLPIQASNGSPSTRGGSAAADFAANKRMPLFDSRSRFLRGADDSLGFDATLTVGASQADAIKNHVHPGDTTPSTVTVTGIRVLDDNSVGGSAIRISNGGTMPLSIPAIPFITDNNTGGLALETRGRSSAVLMCIKL